MIHDGYLKGKWTYSCLAGYQVLRYQYLGFRESVYDLEGSKGFHHTYLEVLLIHQVKEIGIEQVLHQPLGAEVRHRAFFRD